MFILRHLSRPLYNTWNMKSSSTLPLPAIISAATLIFFTVPAHSAVLLTFESSTLTTSSTSWKSDNGQSNANINQATFTLGSGIQNFASSPWLANRWRVDGFAIGNPTQAQAVTANDYWSFTLTPDVGYTVDITSVQITLFPQSTTAPDSFFFSLGSAPGTSIVTSVNASPATNFTYTATPTAPQTFTVNLSGLTGITSATAIRLYGYNGNAVDRYVNIAAGDFVVNGTIVPEPNSLFLGFLGIGLVALRAGVRRRQLH